MVRICVWVIERLGTHKARYMFVSAERQIRRDAKVRVLLVTSDSAG